MQHGLAHRAQQHAGEASAPPGTDHDQCGAFGFIDQCLSWMTVHELCFQVDAGEERSLAVHRFGEQLMLDDLRRDDQRGLPGRHRCVHGGDSDAATCGLLKANRIAALDTSDPSTPTTTRPAGTLGNAVPSPCG